MPDTTTGLDPVSVAHWTARGFDPDTVREQITWDADHLTGDAREELVRRFYAENNPHYDARQSVMVEAEEYLADAFHSEVRRIGEALT